jgi:hypothetical protein
MGVKIMRLAVDTGRMDLAAYALVLALIQIGAGRLPAPGRQRRNRKSNLESQKQP